MKDSSITLPPKKFLKLLTKNQYIAFLEKDLALRYINVNNKWLHAANIKNKEIALGLTDRDCIWSEFADIYEPFAKDTLAGKSYGTLQPIIVEDNRYCWMHVYRWPLYNRNEIIVGLAALVYEVTDHSTIDALYLLSKKNKFGLTSYSTYKSIDDNLTDNEKEILFYLCHTRSVKKIALLLNIPSQIIETTVDNIKLKLNCHNIEQLVEFAVDNKYVSILPGIMLENSPSKPHVVTGFYQFLSVILD